MWTRPPQLRCPGLFVVGTDTGVGKTVVTCAIAAALRALRGGGAVRPGVCKPFATGCRRDREGLVSEDAEALAHFADCRVPLDVINPIRFAAPLAPAVAADAAGQPVDFDALARALTRIDEASDVMLVEGVGGLLVPLDGTFTVLDLALALNYPVVVVARSGLGTINHTAMTVRLLRDAGASVAGVVMNRYDPQSDDVSVSTNRRWIEKLTGRPVLAMAPACAPDAVAPQRATLDLAIVDAIASVDWMSLARRSR